VTAFLALFGDAWRRARDRRSVLGLLLLGLLVAVFCASLEFTQPEPREALRSHLENFSARSRGRTDSFMNLLGLKRKPHVDVRAPAAEDDLPLGLDHVAVADFEIQDVDDFDRVARGAPAHGARAAPPRGGSGPPLTARQRMDFVAEVLRDRGWETVITRAHDEAGASLFVAAATEHLSELEGSWKLRLLFRVFETKVDSASPAETVVALQAGIARVLGGLLGTVVLLAAFGGALPDLLQKGALDLVLARPVGRVRLLSFLYLGAVLTVLLVTAAIFGACALTMGIRSGHFSSALLVCALTTTATFAAIFPVALLTGLVTRSGTLSSLTAVVAYSLAGLVGGARENWPATGIALSATWKSVLDTVWWIAPKTSELSNLGLLRLGRAELSPMAFERFRQQVPEVADLATTLGTTALFAAVVLAIAALLFRRRDC
jgi:hypothetical protein